MNRVLRKHTENACYHCGLPVQGAAAVSVDDRDFCCSGCAAAYEIITAAGGENYYRFRTDYAPRAGEFRDEDLYRHYEERLVEDEQGHKRAAFVVEGIHCASCVWLSETVLRRVEGVLEVEVHLATNRAYLTYDARSVPLAKIAAALARTGYRLMPLPESGDRSHPADRDLLRRTVVAGFFAGNIMLVSVALYAGYFGTMDRLTKDFFHLVSFLFTLPVFMYSAVPFFRSAREALRHGIPGMDLLTSAGISLAFFYSCYAAWFQAGEVYFDSVCFVTFAVLAGRYLESRLKHRSAALIDNLRRSSNVPVRVVKKNSPELKEDDLEFTDAEDVQVGDILVIADGERLPVDGVLLGADGEVDESTLTGEFRPVMKRAGDVIYSGSQSVGASLRIRATAVYRDSALYRIQTMAEASMNDVPPLRRLAERAGRWFIVFVLGAAVASFVYWWVIVGDRDAAILNTIALLIVACPCALNLAVPAAYIAALSRAFTGGVLLRQGQALEVLAKANRFCFDKTGTLTAGRMRLSQVSIYSEAVSKTQCFHLARSLQNLAGVRHPIAEAFRREHVEAAPGPAPGDVRYEAGRGVSARHDGYDLRLGSTAYVREWFEDLPAGGEAGRVAVYLARRPFSGGEAELLARFDLEDEIRAEGAEVLARLKQDGAALSLLTGDLSENAGHLARHMGRAFADEDVHARLSPEDKLALIRSYQQAGEVVVMVGDGINDAAALGQADLGISFAHGADLAMFSSDVLILDGDFRTLARLARLARRTRAKILQNLGLAFAYNVLLIPAAFFGWISPFLGAVFMSLSSITVVGNAFLLLRRR